jgi:hypothetical protein
VRVKWELMKQSEAPESTKVWIFVELSECRSIYRADEAKKEMALR